VRITVPTAVVFDLGGVLIDWNPRYLYRSLLPDDAAIETFLAEVGFTDWNLGLDAGGDWDEAVDRLATRHPDRRALIEAFRDRWTETLGQAIEPTVRVLRELVDGGVRTFALSNWSAHSFAIARPRFDFLDWLDGIVVSGEIGVTKPDPTIFRALLGRYHLEPGDTVFVDDLPRNVDAARELGLIGLRFEDAAGLRRQLAALGLPVAASKPVARAPVSRPGAPRS
jgi:2-haloacid dehalogenase